MKLIIGLGNPGMQYENTRHNIGFMVVDKIVQNLGSTFYLDQKLKGMIASIVVNGKKVLFLKPMTYMNLSGESIKLVMSYYKIDVEDILVISDDLDSSTGRIRLRAQGSAGGHNGHKNIIHLLGTQEYKRVKIGIGRSEVIPVIDWVLQKFSKEEQDVMNTIINSIELIVKDFILEVPFHRISSLYSQKIK